MKSSVSLSLAWSLNEKVLLTVNSLAIKIEPSIALLGDVWISLA